jgi:hypothetical protein
LTEDRKKTALAAAQQVLSDYDKIAGSTTAAFEALRRAAEPAVAAIKAFNVDDKNLRALIAHFERQRDIVRTIGSSDLNMLKSLSSFKHDIQAAHQALGAFNARFELPPLKEISALLAASEKSGLALQMPKLCESAATLTSAMEAMRSPWLDIQNKLGSVSAFAELQSLGLALKQLPAFSDPLADQLRVSLGDWRHQITWPEDIFRDAVERRGFYVDKGFDLRLTDFPVRAFREGIAIAGIYDGPSPAEVANVPLEHQEDGFRRTNAAHDRLQRFETRVREFISERMTAYFGPDWIKHNVSGEMREQWQRKRETGRANGEHDWPLLTYADFTDYAQIITRRDNWEAVFRSFFRRREFVLEAFQRLYPVRICTMHSRIVTPDDELYLYVETKRFLAAIGATIS